MFQTKDLGESRTFCCPWIFRSYESESNLRYTLNVVDLNKTYWAVAIFSITIVRELIRTVFVNS